MDYLFIGLMISLNVSMLLYLSYTCYYIYHVCIDVTILIIHVGIDVTILIIHIGIQSVDVTIFIICIHRNSSYLMRLFLAT